MNLYLSKKKKEREILFIFYFGTRSAKKSLQMIYCLTFVDNNAKRNTAGLMCFDFVKPFCTRDPLSSNLGQTSLLPHFLSFHKTVLDNLADFEDEGERKRDGRRALT